MAGRRRKKRISGVSGPIEPSGPSGPGVGDVIGGDASGIGLPDSLRRDAASDAPELPSLGAERLVDPDQLGDETEPDAGRSTGSCP